MNNERFASVWDALEDTPELAENMRVRSELMVQLSSKVRSWDLTQKEAAKRLHVTQPRLSDMLHGRIEKFSIDALINMISSAGMRVEVNVTERSH